MLFESTADRHCVENRLLPGEGRAREKSEDPREEIPLWRGGGREGRKGMKRAFKVYGQARWGDVEQKRRPARDKGRKDCLYPRPVKYEKERRKGLDGKEEEVSAFRRSSFLPNLFHSTFPSLLGWSWRPIRKTRDILSREKERERKKKKESRLCLPSENRCHGRPVPAA